VARQGRTSGSTPDATAAEPKRLSGRRPRFAIEQRMASRPRSVESIRAVSIGDPSPDVPAVVRIHRSAGRQRSHHPRLSGHWAGLLRRPARGEERGSLRPRPESRVCRRTGILAVTALPELSQPAKPDQPPFGPPAARDVRTVSSQLMPFHPESELQIGRQRSDLDAAATRSVLAGRPRRGHPARLWPPSRRRDARKNRRRAYRAARVSRGPSSWRSSCP